MIYLIVISAFIVFAGFLIYASASIRSGVYIRALYKKDTEEQIIALTFDDGPHPVVTPQILDILRTYNTKATFFCIGKEAGKYPEIIRRIQQEGHLIGNHTYSHSNTFPLYRYNKMVADLQKAEKHLENIKNGQIKFFRPPFGVTNPTIRKVVNTLGYTTVGWSIRSLDTCNSCADKVFSRIVKQISAGDVVLLHDRMPHAPELLSRLLAYLEERNIKAVRVDELFEL